MRRRPLPSLHPYSPALYNAAARVRMIILEIAMSKTPKTAEYNALARQKRVADLYRRGLPQWQIVSILQEEGFAVASQGTISKDLSVIREQWIKSAVMDFDSKKAEELAKIDHIEEVAWQAYELSKQDAVIVVRELKKLPAFSKNGNSHGTRKGKQTDSPSDGKPELQVFEDIIKKTRKGQVPGDPRWIDKVCWCIEMRAKIMNLIKPDQTNVNVLNINWDDLAGGPDEDEAPGRVNGKPQALEG